MYGDEEPVKKGSSSLSDIPQVAEQATIEYDIPIAEVHEHTVDYGHLDMCGESQPAASTA